MFESIKLTEKTNKELENENNVLRKLLQEYVAELEVMKKVYNESALAWQKTNQELADKNQELASKLTLIDQKVQN